MKTVGPALNLESRALCIAAGTRHDIPPKCEQRGRATNAAARESRGTVLTGLPPELAARAFEQSTQGMLITDAAGRIVAVNRSLCALTGYRAEQLIDNGTEAFAAADPGEWFAVVTHAVLHDSSFEGEVRGRHRDGRLFPGWASIRPLRDGPGGYGHFMGSLTDLGARDHSGQDERGEGGQDTLTGVAGRDALRNRLLQASAVAVRSGERFAVLFLGLDRFEDINDSLGHVAGDEVLRRVAQRLGRCVSTDDTLARVGGDKFVVVMRHIADSEAPVSLARRISQQLYRPITLGRHELRLTSSIGISLFPQDSTDAEALIEQADTARCRAKERGPNSYAFFRQHMTKRVQDRLLLEQSLHRAIKHNELVLAYQPQIDVATSRVSGAEALLRWQHPELGLLPPDRFIGLAEETGLIRPIGAWVLRAACAQMKAWRAAGLPPLRVAVNLSGQQILRSRHIEGLRAVLDECWEPVEGWELEIEITESSLQTSDSALAAARLLKDLGITLAIDDFGTGYSSIMALKALPIDRVKIDRSFILGAPGDADHAALSAAAIAMGRALGLKVLAEGIETAEQLAFLRLQGCDEAQGYLIGKPMSADQFESLVRADRPAWV
jgi:diguanylate cyclase (GGDEF)-like protein/PAS domain S-box-containing protein